MRDQLRSELTENPTEVLQGAVLTGRLSTVADEQGGQTHMVGLIAHVRTLAHLEPEQVNQTDGVGFLRDQPVRQVELLLTPDEVDNLYRTLYNLRLNLKRRMRKL